MTAADVDAYLAAVPEGQRALLERLRATILAAAPGATEAISYQIPTFKRDGRSVVAFAAFKDHCSFFPMSVAVLEGFLEEVRPFWNGKGTLHFTADHPLPAGLVKRIVKARLQENAARSRRG